MCEIEIYERDLGYYMKHYHERIPIVLPHGSFIPNSYWQGRGGRVEVYCERVQEFCQQEPTRTTTHDEDIGWNTLFGIKNN
tara:strand:- start:511 stop:753 length:243 start_codon:yes stop_codon:yes gene_type:complete